MERFVIGLMSGTSLDGLDICYVKFSEKNQNLNYEILKAETLNYDNQTVNDLRNAYYLSGADLMKLDADYGKFLGKKTKEFIKKNKIEKVDLIASHGQTIFHQPDLGYTTQIGNGSYINEITGIKTISDFRTQDVALGGEGAPLVPIGDLYLFPDFDFCLNLGGFANITIKSDRKIDAFDICPANIVLNYYVKKMGFPYDNKGIIASEGEINFKLLDHLNALEIYKTIGPQSFGWEFVEQNIIPLIDKFKMNIPDILRTFTEHIAIKIGKKTGNGKMLITGGGAYNLFLIDRINAFSKSEIVLPNPLIIDFKEALIFALLGYLKEQNKVNVLSSVTGARFDHSSGVVWDAFG